MKQVLRRWVPLVAVFATAIAAAVVLAARPWAGEEVVQEAAANPSAYGLCNVSVRNIPEGVSVGPFPQPTDEDTPSGMKLYMLITFRLPLEERTVFDEEKGHDVFVEPRAAVDAETGEVVFEYYNPSHPAANAKIKAVLATLRVGPWEPAGPAWPRTDTPPQGKVEKPYGHPLNAGLEYRRPDPGVGMLTGVVQGDSFQDLWVYTCDSTVVIAASGKVIREEVVPAERAMFNRFLDEVVAP